ncbi:MAG TPA: ATP synthase F1 subunit delta [Bacillota bacterium]|nr:ATP synthase F1 subunit delta [Bacillota bacterium]HPT34838.1 ATP synthase F1 subunit delta [Bacillota bacterium]HQD06288.1 ATP synthase F1 subunit delta [Bacillota bacterium]
MSQKRVARHYAEALFYAAQKLGQEEELGEKLAALKSTLEDIAELKDILSNALISPQEKESALKTLLPRVLSREKDDFVTSLAPEYQRLFDEARDVEPVEVTVAAPLSPAQESELEKRLNRIVGKKVRLEIKIEPDILGGLVLRWEDRVIDASVKKKLDSIGAHLKTV